MSASTRRPKARPMRILFDRLNAVADQITLTIALENISAEMAEIDAIPIAMPRQHQCTTSISGHRTRQTCGICLPAPSAGLVSSGYGRDKRGKYNTRKGNTPRRLIAVVESRPPFLGRVVRN